MAETDTAGASGPAVPKTQERRSEERINTGKRIEGYHDWLHTLRELSLIHI